MNIKIIRKYFKFFFILILILINEIEVLIQKNINKVYSDKFGKQENKYIKKILLSQQNRPDVIEIISNINKNDDFFQLRDIQNQIKAKNLTYIQTIAGQPGKIGNALIMLNNLINICENIQCKNIIVPGLDEIIKKPIIYKKNIIIWPYTYKDKINVDLFLNFSLLLFFQYKSKKMERRINIIKEEVINNLPKFNNTPDDLIIHIRSGDVFSNNINREYGQPPLCFYQNIINNNKFNNIYLTTNGYENPVIFELLKLYPHIKMIGGTIEEAISAIIFSYNLVMSMSTFILTLVRINKNLKNMYLYAIELMHRRYDDSLVNYDYKGEKFKIHKMKPSKKYIDIIQEKWNNTEEQRNLMITENCSNTNFSIVIN